jgi:hypothetical protein
MGCLEKRFVTIYDAFLDESDKWDAINDGPYMEHG